jgi:anthranilate phosphoribosyltransferase
MATITEYIKPIVKGENLSLEQAEQLLDTIFGGQVSEIQVAAFLAAMETKTVTAAELAGLAKSLRKHALAVKLDI